MTKAEIKEMTYEEMAEYIRTLPSAFVDFRHPDGDEDLSSEYASSTDETVKGKNEENGRRQSAQLESKERMQ